MSRIEPAELGSWYEAHAAALVLYVRQLLPGGEAEDAVQDVFIRLMAQASRPEHVKAWLFRSVRNEAVSRLRSLWRRRRLERRRAEGTGEVFEARPEDVIDARAAERLLEGLPREQREAVVLRIWAGLTLAEAAAVTGAATTTVHRRYLSALETLRKGMRSPCPREMT